MEQEQKRPSKISRGLRAVGRTVLEAIAGGVAGWYFTDTFIHSPEFSDELAFIGLGYLRRLDYNATGTLIGAVGVPIVSRVAQAVHRHYKVKRNDKKISRTLC